MKVQVKRLKPGISIPEYQTGKSAGFDLAASEPVAIPPGELLLVPTGLIIEAPPYHFLMLAARSSLYKRHKCMLANGVGIIDGDYCGDRDEIMVPLLNLSHFAAHIEEGERIAQGIILPYTLGNFELVTGSMGDSRGGFGSTGALRSTPKLQPQSYMLDE